MFQKLPTDKHKLFRELRIKLNLNTRYAAALTKLVTLTTSDLVAIENLLIRAASLCVEFKFDLKLSKKTNICFWLLMNFQKQIIGNDFLVEKISQKL